MSHEAELLDYQEHILESLHESEPKNIYTLMEGRGAWVGHTAAKAMDQLIEGGKARVGYSNGNLYQQKFFVSVGKKEVDLPKTPQAMREGVEDWKSIALNKASWAYMDVVHSHTGERLTSNHFNSAKAIVRDTLLVFFEQYDKATEERNEPDAQEGKTVKRKLDFS